MLKTMLSKTPILHALKDNKGVAAIEFAIIAPIMVFLYLGLAETAMLITADRNISHATSILGDLTTQVETIDADEVENIMDATLASMDLTTEEAKRVSIDLISLRKKSGGAIVEIGYASYGSGWGTKFDKKKPSAIMLNSKSGLVVGRVKMLYESPSTKFVQDVTLSETFMFKPRKSPTIPFKGAGKSTTITCTPKVSSQGYPSASCS